eukprot:TRINITY_DN1407_c0_g1_i10.p1 TRINITY_DN1407_c0_g1~~TRINITY_DN1407_c0_g1_i10.p1  ORF type:complete len:331 (-),score=71.65 TRINITY_DN1407_c0_g1_i10:157-1149(-)
MAKAIVIHGESAGASFSESVGDSSTAGKAKATESYGDLSSEAGDREGKRKEIKGSEKSASEAGHKAGTAEETASFEASAKDGGAADEATATKSHEESSVASFSRSIGDSKAAGKAKATESYGDLPSEAGDGAGKRKERKGSEKSASEAGHKAGTAEERASFEASAKDGGAADEAKATETHEEVSKAGDGAGKVRETAAFEEKTNDADKEQGRISDGKHDSGEKDAESSPSVAREHRQATQISSTPSTVLAAREPSHSGDDLIDDQAKGGSLDSLSLQSFSMSIDTDADLFTDDPDSRLHHPPRKDAGASAKLQGFQPADEDPFLMHAQTV